MTTIELLQNSINYIEENLTSDLTISEIAEVSGFSVYHFCRLFSNYVGMPVAAYITKRRLIHGIYSIQSGNSIGYNETEKPKEYAKFHYI